MDEVFDHRCVGPSLVLQVADEMMDGHHDEERKIHVFEGLHDNMAHHPAHVKDQVKL